MSGLNHLKNENLISALKLFVQSERKITAEIVEHIREVDRRKLYLDLGYTSLFSFLTKEIKYTPAAAQRRIDGARLYREVPELKGDLQSGDLNLSQVSMLAYAIRQKRKQKPSVEIGADEKRELLAEVKTHDLIATEKIFAKRLDLEIKTHEKKHYQKDESVRIEMTLSKEQLAQLERVKELISHQNPSPSFSELVSFLAGAYLNAKDPLLQKTTSQRELQRKTKSVNKDKTTSAPVALVRQKAKREYISRGDQISLFKRDRTCRWRDPKTGKRCGSKFQLQFDHRKSVWKGGGSEFSNLQILCSVHNALKYRKEIEGIGHALF